MKTVDFATVVFLLALLIAAVWGSVRERGNTEKKDGTDPG